MWLFTRRQLGPPHSLLNGVQRCNAACQHLQWEPDHWHTEHWRVRGREQTTICFPQSFLSYFSWDRPTTPFIIPTSLGLLPLSWARHLNVNIVLLFSSKTALGGTEETDTFPFRYTTPTRILSGAFQTYSQGHTIFKWVFSFLDSILFQLALQSHIWTVKIKSCVWIIFRKSMLALPKVIRSQLKRSQH